jgi:hypothetical protein
MIAPTEAGCKLLAPAARMSFIGVPPGLGPT